MAMKPKKRLLLASLIFGLSMVGLTFVGFGQSQAHVSDSFLPESIGTDQTQSQLEQEIESLEAKIETTKNELQNVRNQAASLESKLYELDLEISSLRDEISLTKAKIDKLTKDIAEKRAEIEERKVLLRETFKVLYQRSDASSLELIMASDSFNEYFTNQEYLDRLKNNIVDSVNAITDLKEALEGEQAETKTLLANQEGQEVALQTKQNEQKTLLSQAEGQEAAYLANLEELQSLLAAKEEELDEYIASLISSAVSLGPVSRGDIIGKLGNTGYSTGPHVHFRIFKANQQTVDPMTALSNFGWAWPVAGNGGWISQGYGCTPWGPYPQAGCAPGYGFHNATDIAAPQGTPLVAVADGQIIHRGCQSVGSIFATFSVIIDHGNGYYSHYVHMQAPNNSKYSGCNRNTLSGAYSIDYSTTE